VNNKYHNQIIDIVTMGLIPSTSQTKTLKLGIHSFPAWHSALKRWCGKQAGKFTCVHWQST